MITNVRYISDNSKTFPPLRCLSTETFDQLCETQRGNHDAQKYVFATYMPASKDENCLGSKVSKLVCPHCNKLGKCAQSMEELTIVTCENCHLDFHPTAKKVPVGLTCVCKRRCKTAKWLSAEKKKKKKQKNIKLVLTKTRNFATRHSFLVGKRVIVPPFLYFGESDSCKKFIQREIKKTLRGKSEGGKSDENHNNNLEPIRIKEHVLKKFTYDTLTQRNRGGKHNFVRQHVIAKRFYSTGRAVIVPVPTLASNEVILPEFISRRMNHPQYVLLIRFPTLDLQNITFHRVVSCWKHHAIGTSLTICQRKNADFDGDEESLYATYSLDSIAEANTLLNPESNASSMGRLKFTMGPDAIAACRGLYGIETKDVERDLYNMYAIHGSKVVFKTFEKIRNLLTEELWNSVGCGLSFRHLCAMRKFPDDYSDFENKLGEKNWAFSWFTSRTNNSSYQPGHLYQTFKRLGKQRLSYCRTPSFDAIENSFIEGLSKEEFLFHAQAARDALIDSSLGISKDGYNAYKLAFCTKDICVHYDESVRETGANGRCVALHYGDILRRKLPQAVYDSICDELEAEFP